MRFDAVADCQIVRIVDFQILLVAVDGQNMVVADGVNLSLTRAGTFIFQLFRHLKNAMFCLFFHVQSGVVV